MLTPPSFHAVRQISRREMADLNFFFQKGSLQQIVFCNAQIGHNKSLSPTVLFLPSPFIGSTHRRIHAAILGPPFVKRPIAHPILAQQLEPRHSGSFRPDARIANESAPPVYLLVIIRKSSPFTSCRRKFHLLQPLNFGGITMIKQAKNSSPGRPEPFANPRTPRAGASPQGVHIFSNWQALKQRPISAFGFQPQLNLSKYHPPCGGWSKGK